MAHEMCIYQEQDYIEIDYDYNDPQFLNIEFPHLSIYSEQFNDEATDTEMRIIGEAFNKYIM